MNESLINDYVGSPVSVNIFPRHSIDSVCRLIDAMSAEGFRILEILARPIGDAERLLGELNCRSQRRAVCVAVGTIKSRGDAERIVALRPDVLVAPTFSKAVLDVAVKNDLLYIPGVCTLQDIQNVIDAFDAVERKADILKLCPVEMMTWDYVQIVTAIYPGILFCPTGTVTLDTLPRWKSIRSIGPPMESSFVPDELIDKGRESAIRECLASIRTRADTSE